MPLDATLVRPGFKLDRYELVCRLAYGGMAAVWLARFGGKLGFEKLVVLKMILPQYASDPRFQEMFYDEARIASQIVHPNVAQTLDVGECDHLFYIVMEWVDGDSLSKLLGVLEKRGERMPVGVAVRLVADVCAGLHAAHELRDKNGELLGVVHRDVSPQNILLNPSGQAKLIDFGVAKARDRLSGETSAGQLKGKVRYMAPEQATCEDVDRRADVFAAGAVLYEMLSGAPPFDEGTEVATLTRLAKGEPARPLPEFVPEAVRVVVMRAIAPSRNDRFETAMQLHLSLEAALTEIGEHTGAAQIAEYVGDRMTDRAKERKQLVARALEVANARARGEEPTGSTPTFIDESGSHVPAGAMPLDATPPEPASHATLGSAVVEATILDRPDDKRRRARLVIFGAIGALAILTLLVFALRATGGGGASSAARAPDRPPPSDSASASAPAAELAQPAQASSNAASPSASATPVTSASSPAPKSRPGNAKSPPARPKATSITPAAPPKNTSGRDYGF